MRIEEPDFTRRYPAEASTRIDVTTTDGRRLSAETSHPKGHYRNPLADGEAEAKFRGLASGALGREGCGRLLAEVWGVMEKTPGYCRRTGRARPNSVVSAEMASARILVERGY